MGSNRIDCHFIENCLEEVLAKKIPSEMQAAVEDHLAECATCRQLVGTAKGMWDSRSAEPAPDLTPEILQRTSGLACGKARSQLCDWVDGQLRREDGELLGIHLKHCSSCHDLAATLISLKADLPAMAEVTPDPDFCPLVLKSTVARRRWRVPVVKWWESLFQRPRIAFEAAYLGTLMIVGFLGVTPVSKVTRSLTAVEIFSLRSVAFLESMDWKLSTKGMFENQLASGLTGSLDVKISAVRRASSSALDSARQTAEQAWIAGYTVSADGVGWLRNKTAECLQKIRSAQDKSLPFNLSKGT